MRQWFYIQSGEQKGPFPEDQIVRMFQSGQLGDRTPVWTKGLDNWTCAAEIKDLVPPAISSRSIPKPTSPRPLPPAAMSPKPMFLYIPTARFVLVSIISSGLYEVYWIYKNWRYLKERDGLKIQPFWRGVFGIFYCHSVLKAIRNDPQANEIEQARFSPGALAAGWIILSVMGRAFSRVDNIEVNVLGMMLPSFLFLIPAQNYINRLNTSMNPKPAYHHWSSGHFVCMALGMLIWFLILALLMLPE